MLKCHRVLVVGAGAAGTRHIRNLLTLGAQVSVYRYRQESNDRLRELGDGIRIFRSLDEALSSDIEAVVIANRPDQHVPVALAAAERGLHLFIEKPLSNTVERLDELTALVRREKLIVEIGFMMRCHPNLLWIGNALRERVIGEIYYSRVAVGQYLPDWRPGADYRLAYSSRADQGGGVLLDLTHELDYLVWWFGEVEEAAAFLGHLSNLEITSEDVAQILLRFRDGVMAQVHMDYLRPRYYRVVEIVGSLGILTWNDSSGTVTLSRSGEEEIVHRVPFPFDRNTMFLEHMRCFLNRLSSHEAALVSLEEAIRVQRVAVAAHLSCKSRAFVRPSVVL